MSKSALSIVPQRPVKVPSHAELRGQLERCKAMLSHQQREREILAQQLREALCGAVPGEFTDEVRELRQSVASLDESIALLGEQISGLETAAREAHERDGREERSRKREQSAQIARHLRVAAVAVSAKLDELVAAMRELQRLDQKFTDTLPRIPDGFETGALRLLLPRLVTLRLGALLGLPPLLRGFNARSAAELLEAGSEADLVHQASNYCAIGLTAHSLPPEPPEAA